jgi:hypothetical protein
MTCSFGGGLDIHEWKIADEVLSRETSGTFISICQIHREAQNKGYLHHG